MSLFLTSKQVIEDGDLVILYFTPNAQYAIQVQKQILNRKGFLVENKFQSIYGMLDVISLIGKKYGERINLPKGWGYLLRPTCELWTKNVPHRTQIIYTPDISMILSGLGIKPGLKVVEAGTGSGSLSHAFIRAIHPTGHLYTFDFHEKRVEMAQQEFEKHGLSPWVSVGHRDVVADGFHKDLIPSGVDAVFLDLPCPWDVVPHVQQALRRGGKLCTFSPCIEQVQKTVDALRTTGNFILLKTMEVLQRPLSIQPRTLVSIDFEDQAGHLAPIKRDPIKFKTLVPPPQITGHTGYLTFATFVPAKSD